MPPRPIYPMDMIVAFNIKSNFGIFKKPDMNTKDRYLTYDCIHKPALQGILGAIVGIGGMNGVGIPEYLKVFEGIQISIIPLSIGKPKVWITYNNATGFANKGASLNVSEQTLVNPLFRVFLDLGGIDPKHSEMLRHSLMHGISRFNPYMGKNEHALWWDGYREYASAEPYTGGTTRIDSIFTADSINGRIVRARGRGANTARDNGYMYAMTLPLEYDFAFPQYRMDTFYYTNREIRDLDGLVRVGDNIIQLF